MDNQFNGSGIREGEFHGLAALLIETPWSTSAISLFGGHVLSYAPKGFGDLLWMSPTTSRPPKPIRGGIPICWPHFAKQGQPETAPQHGTARTTLWKVVSAQSFVNDEIEIVIAPENPHYHPIQLSQTIRIGATLTQTLTTKNVTDTPFVFTQAFHTYFAVGDARTISVSGLNGKKYLDKVENFAEFEQRGDFSLDKQSDRVYQKVGGDYMLVDPILKRTIMLTSQGSETLVVWNPGAEIIKNFSDIPHSDWPNYFCLEVANAGESVNTLAPGAEKKISQTIRACALP